MSWPPLMNDSPFIIAEVGVNHDGDPDKAHELVQVAAECGADAVKFQTFTPEALVSRSAPTAGYQKAQTQTNNQHDLLSQLTLPTECWAELKKDSESRGLMFLSTPFDIASAMVLAELNIDALKISSGELTNTPLLSRVADLGLPLLVSTGMADLHEVANAVAAAKAAPSLALFHCVSAYPAPAEQCNLNAIPAMHREFNLPIGWSDHTIGTETAIAAVALGARMLEKHITLNSQDPGPDHAASAEPEDFANYVAAARKTASALGDGTKRRMPIEEDAAAVVRRSWHATESLPQGTKLTQSHLTLLRPATGLPPTDSPVGMVLVNDLVAGQPIKTGDVSS